MNSDADVLKINTVNGFAVGHIGIIDKDRINLKVIDNGVVVFFFTGYGKGNN